MSWKGNIDTQVTVYAYATYGNCTFPPGEKKEVVATPSQLEYAADNGYDNAPTEWQKNLIDVLKKIDESLNDPDSKIRNSPYVSYPGLLSGYLNTMDQEDLTNLEQTIDPALNPTGTGTMTPQDQIDQAKEEETEKYKKELLDTLKSPSTDTGAANAIKEANDAAAGEVLAPLGDLPAQETAGDHESIIPIVETFVDGLNALPIVSFFTDLKDNVTFAGDCNFSLSMPNPMNNTVNTVPLSLCSYQPTFAFMGSCLLLITGVRYLMYLFEG